MFRDWGKRVRKGLCLLHWTIPIGRYRCRQTPLGRGYNSMSELVFLFDLLLDLVCKLFRGAKHCTLRSCMRVHINLRGPTQNHFQARAGLFVFPKVIVLLEVTLLLTTFYVQLRLNFVVTLKVALWLNKYDAHTAGPYINPASAKRFKAWLHT